MLYLVTYNHHANLYRLAFLQKAQTNVVVTPTPNIADMLRVKINKADTQTETIAHFIKQSFPKDLQDHFFNKSKYYFFLSLQWKRFNENFNYSEFDKLFNLFTELRSYTLDYELINDLFSDEELPSKAVLAKFWELSDAAQIIDEQQSYKLFLEQDLTSLNNKNILFWGFKHFSGLQIDLLKHLADRTDIYIFVPKPIYQGKKNQIDWTEWLSLGHTLIELNDELVLENQNTLISYSKNRLNQSLAKIGEGELFVASDDFTLLNSLEIPWNSFSFKTGLNLFETEVAELFSECQTKVNKGEPLDFSLMVSSALAKKNSKKLKVISLFKTLLDEYLKFSQSELCEFDLKVLRTCVELDLPRNFAVPLNQASLISVKTKEDFNFSEKGLTKTIIFFEETRGDSSNNTLSDIQKKMKTISPIRNHKLDFNFFKHSLYDLTAQGVNRIFIPENFLEDNFDYSEIFKTIAPNEVNDKIENSKKLVTDTLKVEQAVASQTKKISYTYLQTFLDCPRKFYYKYIDRIDLRVDLTLELAAHEIGRLEHQIIGAYFNHETKVYNQILHQRLIDELLTTLIQTEQKQIDLTNQQLYKIELLLNTKETIELLLAFDRPVKFEVPLTKTGYAGAIDLVLAEALFDFKRSKFSIPSKKDLLEFNSIQLPFYLVNYEASCGVMGYLNVGNLAESMLLVDSALVDSFKPIFEKFKLKSYPLDFNDLKVRYREFEKKLIDQIQSEKSFLPKPKNQEACRYCDLRAVCYAKL